ncbi:uncharacterized protein LOC121267255 [Juglans microcarpa x Juglans regia]|uniref:uncharacterized protein LOC121267255 n=1 Tax=Juglans microcarpa x Juglans regia TaxID=2249226 RepID=UPI001B7EA2E7|nr:uncharacterized protein LOC121267255 [Juglans microcarpa x Juglans regia]
MKDQIQQIGERMKAAQDRQESYAKHRRRNIEFEVGDWIYLKVSPMKGVFRFGKKGNLSPRYVGSYEILERVGAATYRLDLPSDFQGIPNVFHVSSLKKSFKKQIPASVDTRDISLQPDLTYEEVPIQITDWKDKELRNQKIPLGKVLWRNHDIEEATWEKEANKRSKYPYLFGMLFVWHHIMAFAFIHSCIASIVISPM